jgi:histidinol-phosphatase (PHP family)
MREYVESAIAHGLHTLGFSDHSPFFADPEDSPKPWVAMPKSEFGPYLGEAARLREEFAGQINILIGVESDYFADHQRIYRRALTGYSLDYVIGSVHVLDGVDLFRPNRWDGATPDDLLRTKNQYCDLVARSARSKLFDVLGHIDVVKATRPEISLIDTPATERMVQAIAEMDVVVEVNTSGKTKECGGWYPARSILELCQHYGVKLTFGSDAHDPDRIGDEHETVRETLRELGFRDWYVFEQRRRIRLAL